VGWVEAGGAEVGGCVGVSEAGAEVVDVVVGDVDVVVGVVLVGVVAFDVAVALWLVAAEVAACAAAETWVVGLAGAGVWPVDPVRANAATAPMTTRPPRMDPSTSGRDRRRRGRPLSSGGPPAPGGGW
jgi:hypothetical protein